MYKYRTGTMFSGKDAVNSSYPTQWALNPTAYQNIDASQVDWAALAQQWIAMKEAVTVVGAPPAKVETEGGEAPMEVENPSDVVTPPGSEWNASSNSWSGSSWNQWGKHYFNNIKCMTFLRTVNSLIANNLNYL